jgi:hypothetical protein
MAARRTKRKTGKRTTKKRTTLTAKQVAQRRYARAMQGVRTRAKTAKRGKGRLRARPAATRMRRKAGLK